MARHADPVVLFWGGGSLSLGYLGELRWRVTIGGETAVVPDVRTATRRALDAIFRGVLAGREVRARAPLMIDLAGVRATLYADPRLLNGWRCRTRDIDGDVGPHERLAPFIAGRLARAAEDAWAAGVAPTRPPPLAPTFSFEAFLATADRKAL